VRSPGPSSDKKAQGKTPCDVALVSAGNTLEKVAADFGDISLATEASGGAVALTGFAFDIPNLQGAGLDMTAAGGALGMGAGGLQILGGLMQGKGGAGYSNAGYGAFSLFTGLALGRGIAGPSPSGYRTVSQRLADDYAKNVARVAGAVYDFAGAMVSALAPQQKSCGSN
jgi:hypothetical protein